MSTGYQINDQSGLYFLTFQIVDWIDIFTRQVYRDIMVESLKFAMAYKGLQVFAFVIMSNHVHLVAQSSTGQLSDTIGDLKKFTSREIVNTIRTIPESRKWMLDLFAAYATKHARKQSFQVWTHEDHAVFLYSPEFIAEKLNYLHLNPVRAGWVQKPEDYLYSSARWYAGMDCVLEVVDIGLPWNTVQ
jgi:REP element-mobilizing transposase RayT